MIRKEELIYLDNEKSYYFHPLKYKKYKVILHDK